MSDSATRSPNVHRKAAAEQVDAVANFTPKLPAAALLTVSPTFAITLDTPAGEISTDLVVTNGQINGSAIVNHGRTVAIGKGVAFHVTGGLIGQTYNIRVFSGTPQEPVKIVDCLLSIDP